MAPKSKPDEPPPSKLYLVSFGDTMTALLAFFIVLLSMAEEQTGANLHSGTGSFVRAFDGTGLPGAFSGDTTARAVQEQAVSPLYITDTPESESEIGQDSGNEEDNGVPVTDRQEDVYKRFLNELNRLTQVETLPETEGEAVFDIFNRLNSEPPLLKSVHQEALLRVLPTLRRGNYRVDIIVWANMPSPLAWNRATDEATQIVDEIGSWSRFTPEQKGHLRAIGKPWLYSDLKRPVLSIIVRKVNAGA